MGNVWNEDNSDDIKGFLISAFLSNGFVTSPEATFRLLPFNGTYERMRKVPPSFDLMTAFFSCPCYQDISTTNPPRAHNPFTSPSCQASGKAGKRCTASS